MEIHQFNDFGNTISIQDDEGHAQYAQFAFDTDTEKNSNTDATKKGNQLRLSSKLQNTVGNRLKNSSFEGGAVWNVWPAGTSCINVTEDAYEGSHSLLFTATEWSCLMSEYFTIEPGATYTFSAYVKGISGTSTIMIVNRDTMASQQRAATSGTTQWQRVEVSYTNKATTTINACAQFYGTAGTQVYFDCAQVEKTSTSSRFNLLENGDFRHSGSPAYSWSNTGLTASDGRIALSESAAPQLDSNVLKVIGNPAGYKQIIQGVSMSGSAGDSYVLSGWAKANSVPVGVYNGKEREFKLVVALHNDDGTKTYGYAEFNPDAEDWQYAATTVVADKPYHSMAVVIRYNFNANTVYFDGIQLYKETFGSSYTYYEDGNVESVTDIQGQVTQYEYTDNDLTKQISPDGNETTYDYDTNHNVETVTTEGGLEYNLLYDDWGNNTVVSVSGENMTISSTSAYSPDGNRLLSTTDALGHVTTYGYNADTNVLEWVQYPEDTEDTRTEYSYDSMYRLASAACATDTGNSLSATYTYTDDYLTKIQTPSTTYNFTYGDFGLRSAVKAGTQTLASYVYTNDRNRYLSRLDYGNGDSVEYEYDNKGRITKETYEDGDTVTYTYDNDGALAKITDSATGITTTYYYDSNDRLIKYVESGDGYSHSVSYRYDSLDNLAQLAETINGTQRTTQYTYDDDNRVASVTVGDTQKLYTYDDFGRVIRTEILSQGVSVSVEEFCYVECGVNGTSNQLESSLLLTENDYISYSYAYDGNGNITSIINNSGSVTYEYDNANQLIRENNQAGDYTYVWTYDDAGNILSRKEYPYTTGSLEGILVADTVTYSYSDSTWGDLLTSFNDNTITYDQIGNPLTDGEWTYTWEHGRQLASMSNGTTTWTYTYDAGGMRTGRTNGSTTYSYVYSGEQLIRMTADSATLDFTYDAGGAPLTVDYNGTTYYYVTNLQGDIIAIVDSAGSAVVLYCYDAWGKLAFCIGSLAGTLGQINPLRYRGYVYDQETGLYYVSSRYYDPELGRWISPEPNVYGGAFDEGAGLLGYNVYAYCANNPVIYKDETGESITLACVLIGALLGALAGWGYTKYFNVPKDSRWKYILGGALIGAAIGGCAGYALGAGSGAVLWSGQGMSKAAAAFAKKNGLKVVEKTLRGRLLTVLGKILPWSIMKPLWASASTRFLLSYAGKQTFVHVFITAQAYGNMQSIFNSVEMQVVAELGLKIIWHFVK